MAHLKRSNVVWFIGIVTAFVLVSLLMHVYQAKANPSEFTVIRSATASTTRTYLSSSGTYVTPAYDSFNGDPNAADSAVLLTEFEASSTSSVLGIRFQYSAGGANLDCVAAPTTCDWFDDNLVSATSTTNISSANSYTWVAASTATTSKAIVMPTPTRYVRAVYTMSGAAGAIWNSMVIKKQTP